MGRDEKIMFEIYKAVYKKLGVNFDEFSAKKRDVVSRVSYAE